MVVRKKVVANNVGQGGRKLVVNRKKRNFNRVLKAKGTGDAQKPSDEVNEN